MMQDLYLTDEEVTVSLKYAMDFFKEYKGKARNVHDAHKYHCFISHIKINNEK